MIPSLMAGLWKPADGVAPADPSGYLYITRDKGATILKVLLNENDTFTLSGTAFVSGAQFLMSNRVGDYLYSASDPYIWAVPSKFAVSDMSLSDSHSYDGTPFYWYPDAREMRSVNINDHQYHVIFKGVDPYHFHLASIPISDMSAGSIVADLGADWPCYIRETDGTYIYAYLNQNVIKMSVAGAIVATSVDLGDNVTSIVYGDEVLYVCCGASGIKILDLSLNVTQFNTTYAASDSAKYDDHIYTISAPFIRKYLASDLSYVDTSVSLGAAATEIRGIQAGTGRIYFRYNSGATNRIRVIKPDLDYVAQYNLAWRPSDIIWSAT